jgi:hypothetical protein
MVNLLKRSLNIGAGLISSRLSQNPGSASEPANSSKWYWMKSRAFRRMIRNTTSPAILILSDVACTRARDHLVVTSVEPEAEFLDVLIL